MTYFTLQAGNDQPIGILQLLAFPLHLVDFTLFYSIIRSPRYDEGVETDDARWKGDIKDPGGRHLAEMIVEGEFVAVAFPAFEQGLR